MKRTTLSLMLALISTTALARGPSALNSNNRFEYRTDVLVEATKFLNSGNMTGLRGPWCRDFINFILRKTGHNLANNSRMALDALKLGNRTSPHPGVVVVMRGHTGFFVEDLGNKIKIISGNWGHRVSYGIVPKYAVIAYIEPK